MTRRRGIDIPTAEDIAWAREKFSETEPRAVFYRLASWLMERALAGQAEFTESEALSVLLLTWNGPLLRPEKTSISMKGTIDSLTICSAGTARLSTDFVPEAS